MEFLSKEFMGYSGKELVYFLTAAIGTIVLLKVIKVVLINRINKMSRRTDYTLDDLLTNIVSQAFKLPAMLLLGINIGLVFVDTGNRVGQVFTYINSVVFGFYAWKVLTAIIDYISEQTIARMDDDNTKADVSMVKLVKRIIKLLVVVVVGLFVLQNLGIDISALIAGVGIGGLAIAFALQNILEDVFSSISIHFDRPFKEGDFIKIGEDSGVVKSIGMKTSRLETNTGDELVITNRELTQARVRNFKKLKKRMITFEIGVVYGTPVKKLKKVKDIVTKIFEQIEVVNLERVNLMDLGEYSIIFEIRYEVSSSRFIDHANAKQEINFMLLESFEKAGIEFAYPTQTVVIEK